KTSRAMEAYWTRLSFSFGQTMSTISNTWIISLRRLRGIEGMISLTLMVERARSTMVRHGKPSREGPCISRLTMTL
ncbi:MAG: hypothetical protein Q9174_007289, partial [Haloplaca sp. 1 TL-2023]